MKIQLPSFLHADHYGLGILLGVLIPVPVAGLLMLALATLQNAFAGMQSYRLRSMVLLACAANILVMRWYFISVKADKTAKGIMIVTTCIVLLYMFLRMRHFIE